jgi:hypothetical protein
MFFALVVGLEPTGPLQLPVNSRLPYQFGAYQSKEHYDCICARAQPLLPRSTRCAVSSITALCSRIIPIML